MKSEQSSQGTLRGRSLPKALRCPKTGKHLELEPDGAWVRVIGEPLRYPVRNGIPVLVPGAAQPAQD